MVATDLNVVRARSDELIAAQMEAWPTLGRAIRRRLEVAEEHGLLRQEFLQVSLWLGAIKIYVGDPLYGKAFAFEPIVWSGVLDENFEPSKWLETAEFVIDRGLLPDGSLANRLAHLPLYGSERDLDRLVGRRAASAADQRAMARTIVADHQAGHGDQPMLRYDFVAAICEALPGLSKRRARELWRMHSPSPWRRGGRRRETQM
jgi:hypothetical protein